MPAMQILFEPYSTNHGSVTGRYAVRTRIGDGLSQASIASVLPLKASLTGASSSAMPVRATISAPVTRFTAFAGGVVASKLGVDATFEASAPVPVVSTIIGNNVLRVAFSSHEIQGGSFTGDLYEKATLAEGKLFRGQLPLRTYFSDGTLRSDRVAVLIQQPELVATMVPGITLSLADVFAADSQPSADLIHALLDLFSAGDSYSQTAAVLQALADGASLADVAQMIIAADLLDSFIASAVQTDTAQITVLLADGMLADDSADPLSVILAAISEGFYASLTIATGEDGWTAWVMTTQTKAMRRYTDWAFNSYAVRDEVFLGAGEDGIYRMGGDKDAGAAIRWAIRTGKLNFANGQMKSIPLAYIGVTSRGDILLRVRATTTRGVEVEQTYRMSPSTSTDARERRVKIGQGFRSVYWVFEIANDADGEAAEIHEWHALPVKHTGKLI